MSAPFQGRVALVTGGSSGIGKATALAFAEQGANVAIADVKPAGAEVARLVEKLGRKAQIDFLPMQPGDVTATEADIGRTQALLDYSPETSVEVGVGRFVDWYLDYHR